MSQDFRHGTVPSPLKDKKSALVTGGTDGIGKEVARGIAHKGIRVLIVGRDAIKGAAAERELRATTSNDDIHFMPADLSLMREANRLADAIEALSPRLHYLVHSAGIVRGRRELRAEDTESNFATNYLSRFVLTRRLLPSLERAGKPGDAARIVIIGGAARDGTIHFDDVNLSKKFTTLRAVWQFCQANDVFTVELARRLAASGGPPTVTISSLKIGVAKTNIRRDFPMWMKWAVPLIADPLLGQTPHEVATAALNLLLAPEHEGESGALFLKIGKFKPISASERTRDAEIGRRLWELSEQLSGIAERSVETHPTS